MGLIDSGVHDAQRLKELQALPLERKIMITQTRIIEWYHHYNGQVYISFSGGKDSTVLLDLARRCFPDIEAVFVDTGLEYPEVKNHVKSFDNVTIIKPKMTFRQVIEQHGYPIVTKEIARKIHYAQKGSEWAQKFIDGTAVDAQGRKSRYAVSQRWLKLLHAPFKVSNYCCDVMKKQPMKAYESKTKKKPILGTMAEESSLRTQAWQRTGCNGFNMTHPTSKPMSFWTEQDVLQYIQRYHLKIPSVYGDIVEENERLKTSGCDRTGCIFYMFGCHLEKEPNRFQRLKLTHPKLYEYCMKPWNQGGLGIADVLDFINVNY